MRIAHQYGALMKERARRLRRELTPAERVLWRHLRASQQRGFRFRRQQPFGPYVLDFYCHQARLAVEVDGGRHFDEEGMKRDRERDAYLREREVEVLRFTNRDVLERWGAVLAEIDRHLCAIRTPSP